MISALSRDISADAFSACVTWSWVGGDKLLTQQQKIYREIMNIYNSVATVWPLMYRAGCDHLYIFSWRHKKQKCKWKRLLSRKPIENKPIFANWHNTFKTNTAINKHKIIVNYITYNEHVNSLTYQEEWTNLVNWQVLGRFVSEQFSSELRQNALWWVEPKPESSPNHSNSAMQPSK